MPRLPAECVSLIVGCFVQDMTNVKSLHPLLLINRDFFLEAVPYLYEDPFPHVKDKHLLALIALLVRCIPEESRTPLLNMVNIAAQEHHNFQQLVNACDRALGQAMIANKNSSTTTTQHASGVPPVANKDRTTTTQNTLLAEKQRLPPPTINYLSLVTKFGYKELANLADNPTMVRILLESQARLEANPEIVAELRAVHPTAASDRLRILALRPQLTSEVLWGLTQPYLEQVQSLLVPLTNVDHCLDPAVLRRLKSLAAVTLYIEDRPQDRLEQRYEQWLEFTRLHTTRFPRVLRDIRWHRTPGRESFEDPPAAIEDAWSRLLPPLDRPQVIDVSNWKPMLKKWQEIDFSHCRELVDPQRGEWPQTQILARCRALQRLTTSFTNPNALQWALDEKLGLSASEGSAGGGGGGGGSDGGGAGAGAGGNGGNGAASASDGDQQQEQRQTRLVPLQMLNMRCTQAIFNHVTHVALEAFFETLEAIKVLHQEYFTTMPFEVGEGWQGTRLRRLELSTVSQQLVLNRRFFHQLAAVEDLVIVDKLFDYDSWALQLCEPAGVALPSLVNLQLKGAAALVFPATVLANTPLLERLELGTANRNGNFVITTRPGDEEEDEKEEEERVEGGVRTVFLKSRGWTWDWHLPRLTKLVLSGDFAMRFRFSMLAECPMLTILSLSILSDFEIKRTIHEAALKETIARARRSRQDTQEDCGEQQKQQQQQKHEAVVPHLEELRMNGIWQFETDRAFTMLMEEIVGDKIREIIVYGCKQVPLELLVRHSREKPQLRKVTMDLELSKRGTKDEQERMARLGLKAPTRRPAPRLAGALPQAQVQVPAQENCIFILGTQRFELDSFQ